MDATSGTAPAGTRLAVGGEAFVTRVVLSLEGSVLQLGSDVMGTLRGFRVATWNARAPGGREPSAYK